MTRSKPGHFELFPSLTEIHTVLFKMVVMEHGKYFDQMNIDPTLDQAEEMANFTKAQLTQSLKAKLIQPLQALTSASADEKAIKKKKPSKV